ncbi:DUF6121 family protein [Microbacterium sp. 179-B 1A2 NHS]|uniref:DUF6121 family protein n=1 Tax=Microbacterium sp. 179-B 1A2 NHS TaxID=3142383 RepID=UPI0039A03D1E
MDEPGRGVTPPVAAFFATVGFASLAICGFGFTSLFAGRDVIATPDLGHAPGIVAMVLAGVAFAATVWGATRRGRYPAALWVGVATFAAYLAGIVVGGFFAGIDPARAIGAAGEFALSIFAVVLLLAAFVAAWCGVALVRTRSGRPRWPWEDDADE